MQAQFSTAALLACAEAGITLIFIANGAIRARLLGIPGTRQQTRQRLIDLQFLPDWRDRYNRWRWVTEWWVIDRLRPRLGIPARLAHLAEIQAWLRFEVQRHCDPDTDATSYRWLAELSHAWMTEQTQAMGFGAQSELWLDAARTWLATGPLSMPGTWSRCAWAGCAPAPKPLGMSSGRPTQYAVGIWFASTKPTPPRARPTGPRHPRPPAPLAGGTGLSAPSRHRPGLPPCPSTPDVRLYLIAYDIADPKRLNRVHRYLVGGPTGPILRVHGPHLPQGPAFLLTGLRHLIDPKEDDIRAYPLPKRLDYTHLGRQLFPDGVILENARFPEFRLLQGLEDGRRRAPNRQRLHLF